MDGNQVPQELVTEVGVTFEQILEEVQSPPHIHFLISFITSYYDSWVSLCFMLVLTRFLF